MIKTKLWVGLMLSCWLSLPAVQTAKADDISNDLSKEDIPDEQLLEFIADFGDADDETFDLIIYHGKEDLDKTDETQNKKEPDNEI